MAIWVLRRLPIPSKVFGPPKGIISDLRSWVESYRYRKNLADDQCWYLTIQPPTEIKYDPPRSLDPIERVFGDEPNGQISEVFVACLPKARLLVNTGLVISPDDQVFEQSCSWGRRFFPSDLQYNSLRPLLNPKKLSGSYTTITARMWTNYYHWIAECLTRLTLVEKMPRVPIILPRNLQRWHRESLAELGVESDRVIELEDGCYEVDHLYFPSFQGRTGNIADWAYRDLRQSFWGTRGHSPKRGKRIYLGRFNVAHRRIVNEDEVICALEKEGFVPMDGQALSIRDQVSTLMDAEIIVGIHGAGMANILFAPPGATVVEILDPSHLVGCFYAMAESLEHDYWYLLAENVSVLSNSPLRKGYDDLIVPVDKLLKTLSAASTKL